jgi:hypothetical protein
MSARSLFLLSATLALAAGAPAWAKNPPHPSGLNQPLKDGCQRSDFGIGLNISPQWVYMYRSRRIRMASGTVHVSHSSLDDSPLQHEAYDFNGNLQVDKQFRYLIAGSKSSKTNNFASDEPGEAEEYGRLHFEWEQASLPFFAWPTDGDRATIWGSWIWDCGHWSTTENNAPGSTITGEHSELHPINAIVVKRKAPYSPTTNQSETDVYISNDGTPAHSTEECALTHHPDGNAQYDSGYKPCVNKRSNREQPLLTSYKFFVPAPKRPSSEAKLQYEVVNKVSGGSGRQRIRVEKNGLEVIVSTKKKYGKAFLVSWKGDKAKPTKLKVTLKSLVIKQADPNPAQPDPTPPTWNLYLDINGFWKLLNDWAPGMSAVTDGQVITLNKTIDVNVPKGAGVWLQVGGRECDIPADTTVFGVFVHIVKPCGPNRDEINPNPLLLLANDYPGLILDTYPSASAAIGDHVSKSKATVNWPGTGNIDFGHFGDGEDDYELTYSVAAG